MKAKPEETKNVTGAGEKAGENRMTENKEFQKKSKVDIVVLTGRHSILLVGFLFCE